jgi:hypothetical protein
MVSPDPPTSSSAMRNRRWRIIGEPHLAREAANPVARLRPERCDQLLSEVLGIALRRTWLRAPELDDVAYERPILTRPRR